ncbi:hypothetical protein LU683_31495 [Pseudomonas asiatica]|uniref:hypothetical protein n=1 Tax=Pseudomonas TaxID=286 RepID=UPI000EFCA93B|nr:MULTISPECIES: hypothetical protein [Pseudomonas]AYO01509.1 hypothetical protein D8767_22265 [Pseudomonas sp. LTGT-11-2Z]MCE0757404.1 hypothetical protein [Pseudomonas asiatica]
MTVLMVLASVVIIFFASAFYSAYSKESRTSTIARKELRLVVVSAVVILVVGWSWFLFWSNSPQREIDAQRKDCGNTTLAFVMSQNFVKQRLKSPATAKFPYVNDQGIEVVPDGMCGFLVSAYVDSQNGFGATVRSHYKASISYDRKTELWRIGDLTIQ